MSRTDEAELIVGADTHLDTHTAAICGARGRVVPSCRCPPRRGLRAAAGLGECRCHGQAGGAGDRGHPPLRAGPGPAPDGCGPAHRGDRQHRPVLQDRPRRTGISPGHRARRAARADPTPAAASVGHAPCAALTCPPGADRQTRVLHQTLIPARPAGRRARTGRHRAREADRRDRRGHGPGYRRSRVRPRRAQRRADLAVLVPRRPDHHRSRVRDAPLCRGPPRSRYPRAAPTGTASTGLAAASATAPCTPSPSPACAATRSPRLHPNAGPPKARPTRTSAAASSAT